MDKITIPKNDIAVLAGAGTVIIIGSTKIPISPLPLKDLPIVIAGVAAIRDEALLIVKEKKNWDNSIIPIAELIIRRAPEVASELSGIERESFVSLPAATALDILLTCIEVNLEAAGDMVKKLVALAGRSNELISVYKALSPEETPKTN